MIGQKNYKYSAFNYGHDVTLNNRFLNFSEGGSQITAEIPVGSYTLGEMPALVASSMNLVGGQEYSVVLNRADRTLEISASGNFELLIATGSNAPQSIFPLLGFTGSDLVGANSYLGSASGSQYITQTPLKNFSNFDKNKQKIDSVVRQTPDNVIEAISYGTAERMKCEFPLITNVTPQGFIRESATGIEEAQAFLDYAIEKKPLEFLEDYREIDFTPCILDKTSTDSKGTGYEMRELIARRLPFYFEVKRLTFLKIEV